MQSILDDIGNSEEAVGVTVRCFCVVRSIRSCLLTPRQPKNFHQAEATLRFNLNSGVGERCAFHVAATMSTFDRVEFEEAHRPTVE